MDPYGKLRIIIKAAGESPHGVCEYRKLGTDNTVTVEMIQGVPTYWINDKEVTASEAKDCLDDEQGKS